MKHPNKPCVEWKAKESFNMIYLGFSLTNPWFKDTGDKFHTLYCKEECLKGHKYYCFQVSKYAATILEFKLDISWRGKDHAGFDIEFTLFGYTVNLHIYDNRHWNDETNNWYTKEEAEAEAKLYES